MRQEYKTILIIVLLVGLMGLVYIYPFHTHFRFTVSVAVLGTLLLYFNRVPVVATAILSGVAIFAGRSLVHAAFEEKDALMVINANYPAVAYYISYGLWFQFLRLRQFVNNVPTLILLLALCDIFSNTVELLVRAEPLTGGVEAVASGIVGVAIGRAILVAGAYYALRNYQAFVLAEEQMARYTKLTVMIAQLKAELYYLKKSSQDIERVMEDSYWLYKSLSCQERGEAHDAAAEADQALAIARNIHEVKKDYSRVVTGIDAIVEPSAEVKDMRLSEVFFIIEQNTKRYLSGMAKNFTLAFRYETDFVTGQHYSIVSILDNLISNAVEACGDFGHIKVTQYMQAGNAVFVVEDNGCGIKDEDYELLFKAGYSTKFCPNTGKMSTGLGLAHVKNITEMLGGTVAVESAVGSFTRFILTLPLGNIVVSED
jgi:two-component system sensor histidine kinase YcbA